MLIVLADASCQNTTKYQVPVDGAPRESALTVIVSLPVELTKKRKRVPPARSSMYSRALLPATHLAMMAAPDGSDSMLSHAVQVKSISPVDISALSVMLN